MKILQVTQYWVQSLITVPCRLSYRTFETIEPILVEAIFGKPTAAVRAGEQDASAIAPLAA